MVCSRLQEGTSLLLVSLTLWTAGCGAGAEAPGAANPDAGADCGAGCAAGDAEGADAGGSGGETVAGRCGDGERSAAEACDDGNATGHDGCSETCSVEDGFLCVAPAAEPSSGSAPGSSGQADVCQREALCGDGWVVAPEACDDGGTEGGDGCAWDCLSVEPGHVCPVAADGTGGACEALPADCGDGARWGEEACDDGNEVDGDGCSASCAEEEGYLCLRPGQPCVRGPHCGDGNIDLDRGETCDDGNEVGGDGCTELCGGELDFVCPTPGEACVSTVVCGDGRISGAETCDDGDAAGGDGCGADCRVEAGWQCPTAGSACAAVACGDGLRAGSERCDDGDVLGGDGCSAACELEAGFACEGPVCHPTRCGDGVAEGREQCDDGDVRPFDGCSPTCDREMRCPDGVCVAVCGDGLVFAGEGCDDGNAMDGDGCSAACAVEPGYTCEQVVEPPPASMTIPILYRDQLPRGLVRTVEGVEVRGNPDFEIPLVQLVIALVPGMVAPRLGPDNTPVWLRGGQVTSSATFHGWYHDDPASNRAIWRTAAGAPMTLTLASTGGARPTYQFQSTSNDFFPIDGLGLDPFYDHGAHNYNFTSEVHLPFTYQGGETLTFSGDDDVWVFIGGALAVDLGGLHGIASRTVTLDATLAGTLGLVVGGHYEISVFHAERRSTGSNYGLTIGGFSRVRSRCVARCGDGVAVAGEVCDDGASNGAGYGYCLAGCGLGPRCGDGVVQPEQEDCDDGANFITYGGASSTQCAPGCRFAPWCGDGLVSGGEGCDAGQANGQAGSFCSTACKVVKG